MIKYNLQTWIVFKDITSTKHTRKYTNEIDGGGGGGATLRLLSKAAKQLKLLPREDMTFHFLHPRADRKPHYYGPRAKKNCDQQLTEP